MRGTHDRQLAANKNWAGNEADVMFMASVQVKQPFGRDSRVSLSEMNHCQVVFFSSSFSVFLEVNNLESFIPSKQ